MIKPHQATPLQSIIRRLQDPQVMTLVLVIAGCAAMVLYTGSVLAPVFSSLVVAYLLEGMIRFLVGLRWPRTLAVILIFSLFFISLLLLLFVLLPNLAQQLTKLLGEVPRITTALKTLLAQFSGYASGMIPPAIMENMLAQAMDATQKLMTTSVGYIMHGLPGVLSLLIYLVLVPVLVFFYLWDKEELLGSMVRYLPENREMLRRVLDQAELGVGGYIRGKFWELVILGIATYVAFAVMGVEYAFLLGLLTGLSVLIPFVGVAVVTVPVVVLGLFQYGMTWEAAQPFLVYTILQVLDGSVVAPLILGETVKVHPTTIIIAVLLFGALWGLWGVFFAVPLAVLVKSIAEALTPPHVADAHPTE